MPGDLDRGWIYRGTQLVAAAIHSVSAQTCSRVCVTACAARGWGWMDRGRMVGWG